MDAYLFLAERVLQNAREPLGPSDILRLAYLADIVPPQLYGRTQHKTLQARLSEDILLKKERSTFFRTNPGMFFLREFLQDSSIPETYRTPIVARRRARGLYSKRIVTFSREITTQIGLVSWSDSAAAILKALAQEKYFYTESYGQHRETDVFLWSFAIFSRGDFILSYRAGRYREDRDSFLDKRCIGFSALVNAHDRDLFSLADHGIVESAVRSVTIDLDLPPTNRMHMHGDNSPRLSGFILHLSEMDASAVIGVVHVECPDWFEPLKRRLAINDLQWLDLRSPINHLEDFDPWSRQVLASGGIMKDGCQR